jgi:hypothetical protein
MFFLRSERGSLSALSENAGALDVVEIQYTHEAADVTWPTLSAFFDALNPRVRVIAVCGDAGDVKEVEENWHWPNKLSAFSMDQPITGWSKDRFLVSTGTPATLVYPAPSQTALESRSNDEHIAPALAANFPREFRAYQSNLVFDSGDILCDDENAIFSDSLWEKNGRRQDLAGQVSRLTGHNPVWLHGAPAHHIGMYAAPVDDHAIVVGDVDLGRQLWSAKATEMFGKPDFSEVTTGPFRRAVDDLSDAGYRIVRAPIAILAPQVYVTYTNGVFERHGNVKIAYIPAYGIRELDEAGADAYRSQGWSVKQIPVANVFRLRGTIGCLVNVLRRG